ncbi:tRNA uridine-5-carboxymethylaminomethyl(34) synthesis enzyme MnmG [Campylobacter canadensis]|uniref:tRNA uridine 5-carboxymethylaminomethyl modification enzyme MnmG n=1 Tax=Campylobacter canadensis TaxID=449520 RepID=A0ABS7WQ15_9BACT|nr:tRNA uridine-5-carboxymethylaminomethyl(34) synthesis enzyme MnmG [Campylobacter canadensis]MBZ7986852.1 tRNA uridine-5-carboxymethylaminomethyl(34) synthesis enzyme MnmG [Campylobacter canadensis]MBZ7994173.1 tRNA uridine-5-carboxymethylaminomethyl(34) synthesis enzyme MnmG [Campylobacter canadensis]MBZ7995834.1 tRNA uridine-5-carboxymethylaminomethyl(34) synthesis enzyme MnmG [Campylobacter canadensis]MBZ7997889.1 tRNA uridine-5-carboxymethylaminomethyl(34) synthesis enzyme MnmG [Campyloba
MYDIIVIGAGHAGAEAAYNSARMGKKTLLLTMLVDRIAATSCNPAIGGLAKGHLVKEIAAFNGLMPILADTSAINFKMLNESKGAAVQGTRVQIDMDEYNLNAKNILLNMDNLDISQELVDEILVKDNAAIGVKTELDKSYYAKKIILCAGTFLNGLIHVGLSQIKSGRVGEISASKLGDNLENLGLNRKRLKTGTCPRINAKSINFSLLEIQESDESVKGFNLKALPRIKQLPCYIAHTNTNTHTIIRSNFDKAPLFTGQIKGVGPRYCPSIEDKINRFASKESHHLFIEPQTKEANEYYINGFSTSLPFSVQEDMIRSVKGFENAKITRFGYAIEYDFFNPQDLFHSLESKIIKNLYLAGQVNGTTGYEEAAAQGLMASINAALAIDNKEPLILRRDEAYIGVLIDDLVTKGTNEPYRMFTSRAEFRLLLRESNAIFRLNKYAYECALRNEEEYKYYLNLQANIKSALNQLCNTNVVPSKVFNELLNSIEEENISQPTSLQKIIARSSMTRQKLLALCPQFSTLSEFELDEILLEAKYFHYVKLQEQNIKDMKELLEIKIPKDFNFNISGLSAEVIEKLQKNKPENLFEASKISGITPAAIDILQIYIKLKA